MEKVEKNLDKLSHIINEIVDNLEFGNNSYYQPFTQELISIPKSIVDGYSDDELFKEDLEVLEERGDDFLMFETLESSESFEIMEDFVNQLTAGSFQTKLEKVLSNPKPFKNFNHLIHESDFREDWFVFRRKALETHIKELLELYLAEL
jgi:hypothetical protein